MSNPTFENVRLDAKANIYFEGKVVSHSATDAKGQKFTVGLIYPGTYTFNTGAPERMEITSGACRVIFKSGAIDSYQAGQVFRIRGDSAFTITVESGICEYICHFE